MPRQITDNASKSPVAAADVLLVRDITTNTDKKTTVAGLAPAVASNIPDQSIKNSMLANGATRLGINKNHTAPIVTNTYTTYATVTATSTGRECEVEFSIVAHNANSGSDREISAKIQCDNVDIAPIDIGQWIPNIPGNSPKYNLFYIVSSTPAAGSHTWTLQLKASSSSSVALNLAVMKVIEVA